MYFPYTTKNQATTSTRRRPPDTGLLPPATHPENMCNATGWVLSTNYGRADAENVNDTD